MSSNSQGGGSKLSNNLMIGLLVTGLFPFLFNLVSFLPGHSLKLILATIALVGALAYAGYRFGLKGLAFSLVLVFPMYYFTCLGFADMAFFEERAATARFDKKLAPSADFWLGTDYEGRDILATIIIGGKHAYLVALYTSLTALLFGVPLGLLLTAKNIILKNFSFWITQFFEIVPQLFFVLIVMGVYNFWASEDAINRLQTAYSLPIAGVAIGLSSLPSIARIVESRVNQLKRERFVLAFESANVNHMKILLYNILWKNCIPEIVVQTTFLFGSALLLESALSFAYEVGFGDLGTGGYLSWGKLLAEARRSIIFGENVMIVGPPIIATLVSILGINLVGDQLAKRFREEA